MKSMNKSALLLAAALIALPVAASADTIPGWYGTLGAGVNFQNNTGGQTNGVRKFDFKQPGFDAEGSYGYAWDSGMRLEGEAFHGYSALKHVDGAMSNTDFFANALYDFNGLDIGVTPYVGAGVGLGLAGAENIGAGAYHFDGTDVKLAYQGIAGFAVPLDEEWAVTADYRYIATTDPKYSTSIGTKDHILNSSNNVIIGVRYNFDAPEAMPAKQTMAPHVAPKMAGKTGAVAPLPQTFEVFFDYDKASLTDEAKTIIASAAKEYKGGKYIRIVVTGHTDTKGTAKYNKALSDRRAAAVKAEFARLGVSASVVVTQGVGKNGLLVPTNDQVREAQNRRAEIVLDKK